VIDGADAVQSTGESGGGTRYQDQGEYKCIIAKMDMNRSSGSKLQRKQITVETNYSGGSKLQ